jgi:pescadillo
MICFLMFHLLPNVDPMTFDSREIKVHRKKVKKAIAKKNRDLAERLMNRPPTYKLDRLILERY